MGMAGTWLRLDLRRRWRSLVVLALLVALSVGVVLTAVAGARRGDTAFDRLWARTQPATVSVLANQPGFDWAKVRALPEVSALGLFVVNYGVGIEGLTGPSTFFPPGNDQLWRNVERPVVLAGRLTNPGRADEVTVSAHFLATNGKRIGDTLTLRLPSPAQADDGFDASQGTPAGPRLPVRIVGEVRAPFEMDNIGDSGTVFLPYALVARYRANIAGVSTHGAAYVNALIRLAGGEAAIPAFRADLARVSGRSDIDVLDNNTWIGDSVRKVTGYEAACLLAFGLAALLAALVLVGQTVARYTSAAVTELLVLRAVGLTRGQAAASAASAPGLAAVGGATVGAAAAIVASRWMPMGAASLAEPGPGIDADWLVLGVCWAAAVLLVTAAAAAIAWTALTAGRSTAVTRRSPAVTAAATAGLPVAVVVGARFAFEPGRGRTAVPVRPAIAGAVAGVLGVLAALTFSAGVSDAIATPARFGQTWQLDTYYGLNGRDFGPAAAASRVAAADRDVTGFLDVRVAGAQAGRVSVESFTYAPVDGKPVPVVLTAGRMPASPTEIVLAPTTARQLRAAIGSSVRLTGGATARTLTVSGIAFVPSGPHNSYDQGAWLTPGGYDRLFAGAHYAFKFHVAVLTVRPGADVAVVATRLDATVAKDAHAEGIAFTPPDPLPVQELRDVSVLPLALGGFLALLAAGAVGQALTMAVRRRRRELAVLRTLGLTGRQTRLVVVTQASVLAVIGLALGIPLGLAVGRALWRVVANFTPLAYYPPLAVWALALIVPVTLLAANLLAVWPARRAARLRPGQILRDE
jgi:FtsX-like permease family protein